MEQTFRQTVKRMLWLLRVLYTCESYRVKSEKEKKAKDRKKKKEDRDEWLRLKPKEEDQAKDKDKDKDKDTDKEEEKEKEPFLKKVRKAVFTNFGGMIIVGVIMLLAGASFGFFCSGENSQGLTVVVFRYLFLAAGLALLIMSTPDTVDKLYKESNLQFFMTMPFSPVEIVLAKFLQSLPQTYRIIGILVLPFWLGFSPASGMGLGTGLTDAVVLAFLVLPVFLVTVVFLMVILAHAYRRRLVRNNPLLSIGIPVGVALLIIVILAVLEKVFHKAVLQWLLKKLVNLLGFNFAFESMIRGQVVLSVIVVLLMVALTEILLVFIVRLLYQKSLLSRWDLGDKKKKTKDQLKVILKTHGTLWTHIKRELRTVRGMKVYRLSTWFSCIFLPVCYLLLTGIIEVYVLAGEGTPGSTEVMGFLLVAVLPLTLLPSLLNKSVGTAFSRDIYTFRYMRLLPVEWDTILFAKLIAVCLLCIRGSTPYVLGSCIWMIVRGQLPLWGILPALVMNIGFLVLTAELRILWDILKPMKSWSKQTELVDNKGDLLFLTGGLIAIFLPVFLEILLKMLTKNHVIVLVWLLFFAVILPVMGGLFLLIEGLLGIYEFLDPVSKKRHLPNFIKKSKSDVDI